MYAISGGFLSLFFFLVILSVLSKIIFYYSNKKQFENITHLFLRSVFQNENNQAQFEY